MLLRNSVYCAGLTPALQYTRQYLQESGVLLSPEPGWDTRHLLLDVPSFRLGLWTEESLDTLLSSLPPNVTVWGGNLDHPALEPYRTMDLLQDESYLMENAVITAECTIPIAVARLHQPWQETTALIIGWGRIGKSLAPLLKGLGCPVTVATTDPQKMGEIEKAGYDAVNAVDLTPLLPRFRLMINTAPALILSAEQCAACCNCVKIDLASVKGIDAQDVIWARGLPGRCAPERSGKLIAETFLRLLKEESI